MKCREVTQNRAQDYHQYNVRKTILFSFGMKKGNILDLVNVTQNHDKECFEILFHGKNMMAERIISTGQVTPEEQWYNQELDEWVVLIRGEAKIKFDDDEEVFLKRGDYIFIPARKRHRVTYTSANPACIWLAFHGTIET